MTSRLGGVTRVSDGRVGPWRDGRGRGRRERWQVRIVATSTAACLEFGALRGDVETQGGDDGVWMWVCGQRNEWGEEEEVVLRTYYPSPPPTFPALSTPLSHPL